MSEDKKYWEGFDYALSLLEEMYGRSNFQHPYNIADCVKAKVNRLPQEQIRTSIPAASPVSDAVELVKVYDEYIQFLSNNPAESIAHVHGFRHSDADIKKGKALREKISLLKISPNPTNVHDNTAYNKAISDAVQLFYNYWQSDDTVNPSTTKEFIDMLEKLKKPSQSPNQ